jgi:SAM-dependent methyltransferase
MPGNAHEGLSRHHSRARADAGRLGDGEGCCPSFLVGDVAAPASPDGSFDLVVSTLSMHHWADPTAGVAEIGRVLRPGARVLVWDLRPASGPQVVHETQPTAQRDKEGGNGRVRSGKQPEPSVGRVGQRRSRVGDAHSKRQLGRISSSVGRKRTVASLRWAQSTSGEVSVG